MVRVCGMRASGENRARARALAGRCVHGRQVRTLPVSHSEVTLITRGKIRLNRIRDKNMLTVNSSHGYSYELDI